jgi:CRISP-associated protein Cas1
LESEVTVGTVKKSKATTTVNAMLSLAYCLFAKDLTIACYAVEFDPYIGYYHQPRFGRLSLALELMEPFHPLIAIPPF